MGMKEESGGKKIDQFLDLYVRVRNLYLILSFILSQGEILELDEI